uniref:MULE transposase domain-containing protein n=1 Tax=Ciona intestinalis TaxID=7719 RepID=H2XX57_CIOIN
VAAIKCTNELKRRACNTAESPQRIISEELSKLDEDSATQIAPERTLRRAIRRHKQKNDTGPAIPRSRDFQIPQVYQQLENGETFLLHDSGRTNSLRMLVFCSTSGLAALSANEHWFMDGTFKTAPEHFMQIYTVHSFSDGIVTPSVFALLPETYTALFRILQIASGNNLNPKSVLVDFEKASINALEEVFTASQIQGCLFHLSQSVFRKIQQLGLQQLYRSNSEISLKVKMLTALSFVPERDMAEALSAVLNNFPPELASLGEYFEETYIGRAIPNGRRQPIFPISLWNTLARVRNNLPRTNNHLEGWHRRMASNVDCYHLNIWKLINIFKKEDRLASIVRTQHMSGADGAPRRKKYKDLDARIQNLVTNY